MVENHLETLSDDFTRLLKICEEKGYDVRIHYLRVAGSSWGHIIRRSLSLIWDMSTATCVFVSESNSVFGSFSMRKDTQLVQLWHGCGAFKKWGYSVADKTFGDDEMSLERYSGHRNYTLVPVSGEAVCWAYEEAFGIPASKNIVKPIGVSRTDVFFEDCAKREALESFNTLRSNFLNGRKVIVYMPTFRGAIKCARTPEQFDISYFCEKFQNEYILCIKQHPFVKKRVEIPESCKGSCVEIGDEMTTYQLLMVADCLITDYSSVIFEYSLMERPMIFYACDFEEYCDERGFYYPYESFVPGEIAHNMEELSECVERISDYDYNRIKAFRKLYMNGCDGHATERIYKTVLERDIS
jgi:CDP-ribitol ribitolphosphotransferase